MRLVSKVCILFLALLAIFGCGKATPGNLVGIWTMQDNPQKWEFKSDGTLTMDAAINAMYVKQVGTYTLSGNTLTLNLSGKSSATSGDPKDKMNVQTINSTPANPKREEWQIDWKSDSEFTITSSGTDKPVTRTFDRSTN